MLPANVRNIDIGFAIGLNRPACIICGRPIVKEYYHPTSSTKSSQTISTTQEKDPFDERRIASRELAPLIARGVAAGSRLKRRSAPRINGRFFGTEFKSHRPD